MVPFEIRTTPARLPPITVGIAVVLLPLGVLMGWIGVTTTVRAVRQVPDDASRFVLFAAALVAMYGLIWIFVRTYAPIVQVVGMYLFRDRGKQVVAYRLDDSGWHHVVAGTDVLLPWQGMSVAVTERTDDQFHIRVASDGPVAVGRDPFSRQVRRTLRKEGGLAIPMTMTDPTEDELASAIAQQSAGRVALAR